MINIKKQLLLLFVVFSYTNIFADERAPRSQCYINGGWALENTLESKIRELSGGKKSSNPSYKMEIEYERSEDGSSWLVSSYKDY